MVDGKGGPGRKAAPLVKTEENLNWAKTRKEGIEGGDGSLTELLRTVVNQEWSRTPEGI